MACSMHSSTCTAASTVESANLQQGFANEGGPKEVPERHQKVATANATQVKSCIGPSCQYEDAHKPMPVQQNTAFV